MGFLLPLIISAITAGSQDLEKIDVDVPLRYVSSTGVVEGLGGCEIRPPDQLTCWDMDGRPSKPLAEVVRRGFNQGSYHQIAFRFGQVPRYLIVRTTGEFASLNVNWDSKQVEGSSINFMDEDGRTLFLYRFTSSGEPAKVAMRFTIPDPAGPEESVMPFRVGAIGTVGRERFTLGKTTSVGNLEQEIRRDPGGFPLNAFGNGRAWIVDIAHDDQYKTRLFPLDSAGEQIRYVDRTGSPVSSLKYLEEQRKLRAGGKIIHYSDAPAGEYRAAVFYPTHSDVPGAFTWRTNINPAFIQKLKLFSYRHKRIQITGFPAIVPSSAD